MKYIDSKDSLKSEKTYAKTLFLIIGWNAVNFDLKLQV